MASKNTAVLISDKKDLYRYFEKLLKPNNFEVFQVNQVEDFAEKFEKKRIDLCLIDNSEEPAASFKNFFDYLSRNHPQAVIVSDRKLDIPVNRMSNFFFQFDFQTSQNHLALLFRNISELLQREKSRIELAAMLVHDARSPLNSLVGYLELLLNETFGELNAGQKNLIEKAMILGDKALDMLEDINEIYQSEQFLFRLERENFDFSKVVDEVLIDIWVRADQKNIKIKKAIPESFPFLFGDPYQIQRVLTNLIGNSIKYCPDNSTIIIKARKLPHKIAQISVMDNGGGIPENQLQKIFDKFFRVPSNSQIAKGYGLGLYICKIIIKAHGGKITAENNDLGGISFHFTLPMKK